MGVSRLQRLQSVVNQPTATAHMTVLRGRETFGSHRLRQTMELLINAVPGSCVGAANLILVPHPGAPAGVQDAYLKPSFFGSCLANGLPASEARALAATQRPLSTAAFTEPTGVPAWKTMPSWAVIGTADHAIPPAEQLAIAKAAHARITEIHAPHLSMIADSGAVTKVILEAVHATT